MFLLKAVKTGFFVSLVMLVFSSCSSGGPQATQPINQNENAGPSETDLAQQKFEMDSSVAFAQYVVDLNEAWAAHREEIFKTQDYVFDGQGPRILMAELDLQLNILLANIESSLDPELVLMGFAKTVLDQIEQQTVSSLRSEFIGTPRWLMAQLIEDVQVKFSFSAIRIENIYRCGMNSCA